MPATGLPKKVLTATASKICGPENGCGKILIPAKLLTAGRRLKLTPRECQVAALLSKGLPWKSAASEIGISHWTLRHYVSGILRKSNCGSFTEFLGRFFLNL